jgi:lysophospholipase L1-like esterase
MKKITFYGDSVMAGYSFVGGQGVSVPGTVPAVCQELLGPGACCTNKGIGGTTAAQWLFGTGAVPRDWAAEMASHQNEVVAINCGINDAFVPGYGVADHRWCYQELTSIARAAGKIMVFVTPNPINLPHNTNLWQLKHAINQLASEMAVPKIDMYDAIAYGCPNWPTELPDAVHPSPDLYRFMGHVAYMSLKRIL